MHEKRKAFLEIFPKKAGNISVTCEAVGVSRRTYYNWFEQDEEFKDAILSVKESMIDFTESKLMELIREKNVTAIIFYLKTQAKHRGYIERAEVEHDASEKLIVNLGYGRKDD